MATKTRHLILATGAALAALVLAPACSDGGGGTSAVAKTVPPAPTSTGASVSPHVGRPLPYTVDARLRLAPRPPCRAGLPKRLPSREVVVPILMYHLIDVARPSAPEITRRLTVDPADFARQMKWLARSGYRTITQQELFDALMCGRRLGRRPILITIDDGYADAYTKAAPILSRLGMRATAYVITGRISGSDPSFLTWAQVRGLERSGVEVASHTVTHRGLTLLSDAEAYRELVRSRQVLERKLGHPAPWFAYPMGDYDARIEALARRAGYLLATTTEVGAVQSARRPLALPRLRVLDSTGVDGLAELLRAYG